MDPVLAKALKKKEQLERQLADIERFITLHRRFSGGSKNDESPQSVTNESPKVTVMRRPTRPAVFVKAIETVLRRAGKPMSRAEIVEALAKEGVAIPSTDPVRYIGTILWRDETFEGVEGGYWLKGIRIPKTPQELIELVAPLTVGGNRT